MPVVLGVSWCARQSALQMRMQMHVEACSETRPRRLAQRFHGWTTLSAEPHLEWEGTANHGRVAASPGPRQPNYTTRPP